MGDVLYNGNDRLSLISQNITITTVKNQILEESSQILTVVVIFVT